MIRYLSTATIALAGLAGAAIAQSPSASSVCAGMPTPAEEIACLRGALEESRNALSRERGVVDPAPPAVQRAPAPPAAAPEVVQRRQPAPVAPPPARRAEQLGDEQVAETRREAKQPEPKPGRVRALVAGFETDYRGFFTLRLDNGQVWRQSDGLGVPLRLRTDRQYPVEIRPSGFGGYRMNFTDLNRQIVVRRVQ